MGALRLKRVQTIFVGCLQKHTTQGLIIGGSLVEVLTVVCSESGSNWPI